MVIDHQLVESRPYKIDLKKNIKILISKIKIFSIHIVLDEI
jgi:hypothetical protein